MSAEKPPFARDSDTSRAAAESIKEDTSTLRARVLDLIKAHPGGLTTDEVEQMLGLNHQTASPRMWELHKRSLIGDTGKRRKTRSGRLATVYRALSSDEIDALTKQAITLARDTATALTRDAEKIEAKPQDPFLTWLRGKKGKPQ